MKYALYARYSSHQQDHGFSIEAQLDACHTHAEKQGWILYRDYIDRAISGKSDDRAAFQEMIKDATHINPAPFDCVLVHKTDRFARNRHDSVHYKNLLKLRGIRVFSVTQPTIGGDDPSNIILESVLEGMDEFYSVNLARETLKGMIQTAKMGFWSGGRAPFGYNLIEVFYEDKRKKKLEINPAESVVVKQIYDIYLQGDIGVKSLTNHINEMGYKTREKYNFTRNTIWQILTNEKYCGDFIFGKNQERKGKYHIKFEPVRVYDCFPAIIPRVQWERTQMILKERSPEVSPPRTTSSSYLLSGLIKCGKCGARYIGVSAKSGQHYYYRCGTNNRAGKAACDAPMIPMFKMDSRIIDVINNKMLTPKNIKRTYLNFIDMLSSRVDRLENENVEIKSAIADKEKRLNKIYLAIEEGKNLTLDDLSPRIRILKTEIESLRIKELELTAKINQIQAVTDKNFYHTVEKFIADLLTDDMVYKDNRFVLKVIDRIELTNSNKECSVYWHLPAPEFATSVLKLPYCDKTANFMYMLKTTIFCCKNIVI